MKSDLDFNRRDFLKTSTTAAAGLALGGASAGPASPGRILVSSAGERTYLSDLARAELARGLAALRLPAEVMLAGAGAGARPSPGDLLVALRVEPDRYKNVEAGSVRADDAGIVISGASAPALLHAVFRFLEQQGAFFGIDGESYPIDAPARLRLPEPGRPWSFEPRFAVRGLVPWPDFLNCVTVFNAEDFRAYFENMLRMGLNTFGMHVYSMMNQWTEPYLSVEFGGVGHLGFLDSTATHRWGHLPQRTSSFGMGGDRFYDTDVFGSDAARLARDPWEHAARARELLGKGLAHARKLGIRTGLGFEPYQIPDEILRALPPEALAKTTPEKPFPRFDTESVTAKDLLETRLGQLLEAYPDVDYVWMWEDEWMNWESRRTGQPLSVTPFVQAHAFLERHAPGKRMVLAGWGGVARHFGDFHKRVPGDIVFSCLSDSFGWDPVHEVFGQLETRERWPVLWLEDDPAMWLPQFHVHRFAEDIKRAHDFGCQGLMGIHWRHRIVDPTAGFQARASWDAALEPRRYFEMFAATQASGARAPRLAEVLTENDRDRLILCTFTGEIKDGHAQSQEYAGDYSEGFMYWNDYEPKPETAASQRRVAGALRALADGASSDYEAEKLRYLAGYVGFLVPYTEAWTLAHRLHLVLQAAGEARAAGRAGEAREKVRAEGVPLWLKLAPEVRRAMLEFQGIVATRNDLGTLASLHNKFVRLALVRLRMSLKEHLGELPPETEAAVADAMRPDADAAPRLIVPTRPTMLAPGETVKVLAIVAGPHEPERVTLRARLHGASEWAAVTAAPAGRRTYDAVLGPLAPGAPFAEYYIEAALKDARGTILVSPGDAPMRTYRLTIA